MAGCMDFLYPTTKRHQWKQPGAQERPFQGTAHSLPPLRLAVNRGAGGTGGHTAPPSYTTALSPPTTVGLQNCFAPQPEQQALPAAIREASEGPGTVSWCPDSGCWPEGRRDGDQACCTVTSSDPWMGKARHLLCQLLVPSEEVARAGNSMTRGNQQDRTRGTGRRVASDPLGAFAD